MTEQKISKPWHRRRRFVYPALLLVLGYFCFVPSRLKISPETTLITEPLTPDGRPDYFAAYEKTWASKLSPPEDNGLRMMIAAVGPRMLEMNTLANEIAWELIPIDEKYGGKKWFEERWMPLCEHMYIDPYNKPKFYDSLDFYSFMQPREENGEIVNVQGLHEKLIAAPWKSEEHPELAEWLKERSPVLDLFGVAVRKPNYVCWRPRPVGGCCAILLPDIQANRACAWDLQVRITERLGRGDVDGAWYDVMSMFHLSRRHFCNDVIYVTKMVGAAVDRMACQSAAVILKQSNPSREQLDRFAHELSALPSALTIDSSFEEIMMFDVLHVFTRREDAFEFLGEGEYGFIRRVAFVLPLDLNVAGRRLAGFYAAAKEGESNEIRGGNPLLWQRTLKKMNDIGNERKPDNPFGWLVRLPLIRTRSEMVADLLASHMTYEAIGHSMCQTMAQFDLLRIAVALERYQKAEGRYPNELEQLVPNYLDEIPLDPFTGRKTIAYKRNPEEGSPYLIYSYGRNGEDDGGKETQTVPSGIEGGYEKWIKHDIVFKR